MIEEGAVRTYRTIWISDVHLGTRGARAEELLSFLKQTESETLYLVGDIIDGWRLRKTWYWPQSHNDVVQKLLRKARKGTKVYYIPGNHDEAARQFLGHKFGEIEVVPDIVHTAADGRRFLVIHGDQFDTVVRGAAWLAHIGDTAYTGLLIVNRWLNWGRRLAGRPYWSLSAFLKSKAKQAVDFVGRFQRALIAAAQERNVEGVICGHVHTADMREMGPILYVNDGDWVESCTALVEHHDGRLEILRWLELQPLAEPAVAEVVPLPQPKAA